MPRDTTGRSERLLNRLFKNMDYSARRELLKKAQDLAGDDVEKSAGSDAVSYNDLADEIEDDDGPNAGAVDKSADGTHLSYAAAGKED